MHAVAKHKNLCKVPKTLLDGGETVEHERQSGEGVGGDRAVSALSARHLYVKMCPLNIECILSL